MDFFMLCDRDAVPLSRPADKLERESNGHLRILKRYHIENYFLDSSIIAQVFDQMEPDDSWLRSADAIEARLREIARSLTSYAVALAVVAEFRERVGNLDIMPDEVHDKTVDEVVHRTLARLTGEKRRIADAVSESAVESRIRQLFQEFEASLEPGSNRWRIIFPGKPIIARFAGQTRLELSRLKAMYIRAAETSAQSAFSEIIEVFDAFASTPIPS